MIRSVLTCLFWLISSSGRCAPIGDAPVTAEPGPYELSFSLGTTAAGLDPADAALIQAADAEAAAYAFSFGGVNGNVGHSSVSRAAAAQIDFGHRLQNGGIFGIRTGTALNFDVVSLDATGPAGDHLVETWNLDVAMFPILVGGSVEHPLSADITVRGSLFAGPAFARAALVEDLTLTGPSNPAGTYGYVVSYAGTTFAADLGGEFDWQWTPHLAVTIELGYRYCRFIALHARSDVNTGGSLFGADVAAGDSFQDRTGRAVPFDFSGFKTLLGLRWRFDH